MRKSITQELGNGCGIACFAFVCDISYKAAEEFLGPEQAKSNAFIVKNFASELNRYGKSYHARHLKPTQKIAYKEGAIVLIRRSKRYPVGHYLARHDELWMDPWVNLLKDRDLTKARSGYRKRLPGSPMYAIEPNLP